MSDKQKKQVPKLGTCMNTGDPGGIRTPDPRLRRVRFLKKHTVMHIAFLTKIMPQTRINTGLLKMITNVINVFPCIKMQRILRQKWDIWPKKEWVRQKWDTFETAIINEKLNLNNWCLHYYAWKKSKKSRGFNQKIPKHILALLDIR